MRLGNILTAKDAEGNTTQYQYDDLNRRTKVIDAKAQDTDYVYDKVGNLKEVIDTPSRKTRYTYDNLNRSYRCQRPGRHYHPHSI